MSSQLKDADVSSVEKLVGTTVDGKYRIEGLLGRGGMGAVFRALHLGTDRTVALKVIVPDYAEQSDFLRRFEREARACGRLRHPNIVDVTDFGYDDSGGRRIAYLVMEYLDGCSLADVLRDEAVLPIDWVIDILQQAGSAVEEAHRAGILHRDLKPDNIWLEPNRRGGYTVKVLDFGLAKLDIGAHMPPTASIHLQQLTAEDSGLTEEVTLLRGASASIIEETRIDVDDATRVRSPATTVRDLDPDENATAVGSIVGTPAYMSPEQCRGLPLTARSDVYSLAVMAYRLFGGTLPFTGRSEAVMAAHVSDPARPLRELRPALGKQAGALVMRALAKAAEERPASAGAFTEMLAAHAQGTAAILEDAVLMYLQHLRAFLSVSVVGLSPVILLGFFAAANALAFVFGMRLVPAGYGAAFVSAAVIMTVGPGILLVQGAVVPAVMQARVAPLQPIDVASLERRFRPRLRAYMRAVVPLLAFFVTVGVWQIVTRPVVLSLARGAEPTLTVWRGLAIVLLPNLPLIAMLLAQARSGAARSLQFLSAVAIVEGLSGKQARTRCAELAASGEHLRPLRAVIIGLGLSLGSLAGFTFILLSRRLAAPVALGTLGIFFALVFVIFAPFASIISALTYLRARRALGEPLDRALADFERAVLPESHWRLGARERVATLIASRR